MMADLAAIGIHSRESLLVRWQGWGLLALAIAAGVMAKNGFPGSAIALVLATALAFLVLTSPVPSKRMGLHLLITCGAILAVLLQPGTLNLAVSWLSLMVLALAQRGHGFGNLLATVFQVVRQFGASFRRRPRISNPAVPIARADLRPYVMPVLSVVVFAGLLAVANPLIGRTLEPPSMQAFTDYLLSWAPAAALLTYVLLRAILRSVSDVAAGAMNIDGDAPSWHARYFPVASVAFTIAALNAMFLVQNSLDFTYLWNGVELPPGISHATYVHRGAYALIATALAAAVLVIFALWPRSQTEKSAVVRGLVYLWIGQNLLLVISSASRTLSYVDAYGLTIMRLSGLIWMGLVAMGLLLIALRIVLRRGNLWLLNGNMLAAFATLWTVGFTDLAATIANYSVDHALLHQASEPLRFDYAYALSLGPSAIPALRRLDAALLARSTPLQPSPSSPPSGWADILEHDLAAQQADWRRWTLRHAFIGNTP